MVMNRSGTGKRIAIIGASYLQLPLIRKAKERGYETHVFAWAANDVGETYADFFYPISIVEKEKILETCMRLNIDGICSIASDLASITVNYVANSMGLIGNSQECVRLTTNKYLMRECFAQHGDPSPNYYPVNSVDDIEALPINYPVIVKPIDRSGSRGITKVAEPDGLKDAIAAAFDVGFKKSALIEEFVSGKEYSVEYISWDGNHTFLALTEKFTTGVPNYIETGHLEPAPVNECVLLRIKAVIEHALDSLKIRYGASHSEVKVSESGEVTIIEIGGRMGGDNIGSTLVEESTGYDFVDAVIDVCTGKQPPVPDGSRNTTVGIRFVISEDDIAVYNTVKKEHPEILIEEYVHDITDSKVTDSSARFGYFTIASENPDIVRNYMPQSKENR